MCQRKTLQGLVCTISMFLIGLTLLVGISLILREGDLEMNVVMMVVNICITIVLFYGAKTKDTTHLRIWLFYTFIQIIGLFIGMCYFAYQSEELRERHTLNKPFGSITNKTIEKIWKLRITSIVYSVSCGVLAIALMLVSIIVKKLFNKIQRDDINQPRGR